MKKLLAIWLAIVLFSLLPAISAYKESDQLNGGQTTHQFIMDWVPTILRNDGYPFLADFLTTYLNQMKFGSMRADDTLWDSREHYMDPNAHGGYLLFKSAGQLADERFDAAVDHWLSGDKSSAFYDLGWSTHLVQDLTVPHHAAVTALNYHAEYEQWVYDNQNLYAVESGGIYDFSSHVSGHYDSESDPFDWVDYNAHFSIDYYSYVNGQNGAGGNDYDLASSILLPRAQRTSAGYVYMFLLTVNSPPVADAGTDMTGNQTEPFIFDGALSHDDMAIVNYTWEFGDGSVGYGISPTHFYSEPGTYDCNLTVRDSFWREGAHQIKVTVLDDIPPLADAGDDMEIDEEDSVQLDASGSSDNVGISEFRWILDDTIIGSAPSLTHTFRTYGVYTVTLYVADEAGNEDTDTVSISVRDAVPPIADAGPDQTSEIGQAFVFDASNSTDNNEIVSYSWDFGDGNTSTEKMVIHGYEQSGTYIVTLLVTDVSGNTNTDQVTIHVMEKEESPSEGLWLMSIVAALIILIVILLVIIFFRRTFRQRKN
jgi:PKD repeat protein